MFPFVGTHRQGGDQMIVLQESASALGMTKDLTCPGCERGKIGNVSGNTKIRRARKGRPVDNVEADKLQVKCSVCAAFWIVSFVGQFAN